MKHNTHIYVAAKAIELTRQSVDNTRELDGTLLSGKKKGSERKAATHRQRILQYYQDLLEEATWVPDDVLRDNDPNHIFKLFTSKEFPKHGLDHKPVFKKDDVTYYKFAGGLPYRVDHVARSIIDMCKLRDFNDQCELKQIMYQYLLLSHYVTDAHVPMHCDLRDDPPKEKNTDPSKRNGSKGKPAGEKGSYMKDSAHAALEGIWEDAVLPVAIKEGIIKRSLEKERIEPTELSPSVTFRLKDCKKGGDVSVVLIPEGKLMEFMIDVCIKTKIRCQKLFPVGNAEERNDEILPEITREIFADSIGNLMSIWRYIWTYYQE